jgi:CDGSH-type Zn-finger protein
MKPRCEQRLVVATCPARLSLEENTMPTPVRASNTPFPVAVEAGKEYWWCACGQSKNQPFCDGSHKAERQFTPVKFTATETKTVYFCGCKGTGKAPLCDGTHSKPI